MIVWICNKCGCELTQEEQPKECPLCKRSREFEKVERKNPDKEDKEFVKKYDEVIDKLEEYTEDCEPEGLKNSFEY
ncbi:hypothetical protein ACFLTH_05580 [Bacteroidota bacterium]